MREQVKEQGREWGEVKTRRGVGMEDGRGDGEECVGKGEGCEESYEGEGRNGEEGGKMRREDDDKVMKVGRNEGMKEKMMVGVE